MPGRDRLFFHRFPGGKVQSASWIVGNLADHDRYVEAYAGAANVLLRKPRSRSEWLIERDASQAALLRVARDRSADLVRGLSRLRYGRETFDEARDRLSRGDWRDELDLAGLAYVVRQLSRGGRGLSYSRQHGSRVARWWARCLAQLPRVGERLKGVEVVEGDALEWLPLLDGADTLAYCDPPYLWSARSAHRLYRHEMDDDAHRELLRVLDTMVGRAVLSGYPSPLYDRSLEGWRRVEKARTLDSWRRGDRPRRTEVLWIS